ncbi:glycosyltransferase [Lysobacter pythonis]|uniref:Glycosyltransferase n=2 Tax=Solilutibacter pythonis TaxID=2483112 RepID=A0A3M2I1E7_9GAMM|nr:glycosyltransferase [Lysobacter pythonis]
MKLKYGKFRIGEGIIKFIRIMRSEGSRSALARTFGLLSKKINSSVVVMESKKDVAGFFRAVYSPEYCNQANPILRVSLDFSADVDILWFIPDFGAGSGGHLNIIRFVSGLEKLGMRSAIVIVGGHSHANHGEAKAKLDKYFGETSSLIYFEEDLLPKVNKIIATSWITAHFAKHYSSSELDRYYFVQDYEPLFYPAGFDAIAAAVTYSLGFQSICAGSWIVEELKQRHGVKALGYFGFSYDKEIYKRVPKRDNVERVFFYVRPPTARRGFELGLLALDLVGRLRPGVNFIFAGWDVSDYRFDHIHLNAGVLHTSELPDLYSQCDVALILSFSNMSLLPYEVMACGCAVVTNNDACATWGLNKEVAEFAAATPEALAQAIIRLLEDKDARAKRVEIARKFVEETCWDREIGKVGRLLVGAGE